MAGDSNDESNFPQKLLLTNTQVSRLRKAFANDSSANINFSKTQLSKMIQLGRCFSLESLLNPEKIIFEGFKKIRDSAEKVQMKKIFIFLRIPLALKTYLN